MEESKRGLVDAISYVLLNMLLETPCVFSGLLLHHWVWRKHLLKREERLCVVGSSAEELVALDLAEATRERVIGPLQVGFVRAPILFDEPLPSERHAERVQLCLHTSNSIHSEWIQRRWLHTNTDRALVDEFAQTQVKGPGVTRPSHITCDLSYICLHEPLAYTGDKSPWQRMLNAHPICVALIIDLSGDR